MSWWWVYRSIDPLLLLFLWWYDGGNNSTADFCFLLFLIPCKKKGSFPCCVCALLAAAHVGRNFDFFEFKRASEQASSKHLTLFHHQHTHTHTHTHTPQGNTTTTTITKKLVVAIFLLTEILAFWPSSPSVVFVCIFWKRLHFWKLEVCMYVPDSRTTLVSLFSKNQRQRKSGGSSS